MQAIGDNVLVQELEVSKDSVILSLRGEVRYCVVAIGEKVDCVKVGDQVVVNKYALKQLPDLPVYRIQDIEILAVYTN